MLIRFRSGTWIAVVAILALVDSRRSVPEIPAAVQSPPSIVLPAILTGWVAADHYVGPTPRQNARLVAGQQFLCFYNDTFSAPAEPFRDSVTGQIVPPKQIAFRVLTLQSIQHPPTGAALLTFSVEGSARQVTLNSDADVDELPALTPLLDDAPLDSLRRRYEGHLVWCYGGNVAQTATDDPAFFPTSRAPALLPLRVKRILRLDRVGLALSMTTWINNLIGNTQSGHDLYTDDRPLLVELTSPTNRFAVNTDEISGPQATLIESSYAAYQKRLKNVTAGEYRISADPWELERVFSLQSPQSLHPDWTRQELRHLSNAEVVPGMTRDQVGWATGWPAAPGDIKSFDQLRALPVWVYQRMPFDYTITFNSHGRVSKIDAPQLP